MLVLLLVLSVVPISFVVVGTDVVLLLVVVLVVDRANIILLLTFDSIAVGNILISATIVGSVHG